MHHHKESAFPKLTLLPLGEGGSGEEALACRRVDFGGFLSDVTIPK